MAKCRTVVLGVLYRREQLTRLTAATVRQCFRCGESAQECASLAHTVVKPPWQ